MAYVYRFLDINEKVIYVGYTGQTLDKRIAQHFEKGHLDKECYKSIARIEYQHYKTKADAQIMEVVEINRYKPKFNKLNKQNDSLTLNVEEKEWKTYRVYKTYTDKSNENMMNRVSIISKILAVIYIILLLLILYFKYF